MLSRVAGNIYWMARYLERAEDTARLINVNSILLLDLPQNRATFGWTPLIAIMGSGNQFYNSYHESNETNILQFLLGDSQNSSSILSCLAQARENMRTSRDIIPAEAWEQLNDLYLFVSNTVNLGISKKQRFNFLKKVILGCQQITGIATGTMLRDAAYNFLRLGAYLERADMTSRIVDVRSANLLPKDHGTTLSQTSFDGLQQQQMSVLPRDTSLSPFDNIQWMSVLRSLTAYQAYRRQIRLRVKGEDVLRFLLQDTEFPRSVLFCLGVVQNCLSGLPKNENPLRDLANLQRKTQKVDVTQLAHKGLHEFIDELQIGFGKVHEHITENYFAVGTRS